MALTSWKELPFFSASQVPVPADDEGSYVFDNEVLCLATGSDSLYLGDTSGTIRILDRSFKVVRSFQASDNHDASITHLRQIPDTDLLLSIAEDLSNEPILKVWALDKTEKRGTGPKCLCSVNVQNQKKQFPVSAFVALEDLSQVAVGFGNGAVTVIRGDFIHDRGTKQRTVFESEDPVTALEVREGPTTVLFIATVGRISSLIISGKSSGQPARTVDNRGCGVGCMTLDKDSKELVVVRDDAIYTYTPSGRGQPLAFDGPKKMVKMFKHYVALVCLPRVTNMSKSRMSRKLGGREIDEIFSSSSFTLLDTDLKYVAYKESISAQIKEVFVEWDELFLLTLDGKLYRYQEKTLQQKLDILYQRNLYILAINLAQKSGVEKAQQNIIFRKYGDHLYQKGDFDTAMQQYLRAIDNTEPSQVIRKFLDTQRIYNLIDYLEELHEHDKATIDHTTLLLNCYAKLKDTEKLDAFVRAPGEPKFDLDTAVAMCRQGGYFEQAAYLATRHGDSETVIDILVEDSKKYTEALEFIWKLPPSGVYPPLMKYARVLIEHCSSSATQLFIDYYTGNYRPKQDTYVSAEVPSQPSTGAFANLSALLPLPYMNKSAVDSPSASADQKATVADATLAADAVGTPQTYDIPQPRTAFTAFIAHPKEFITFLEALLSRASTNSPDDVDLATTLFEMYLDLASSTQDAAERERYQQKARALITSADQIQQDTSSVDTSNVLLLSSLSNFQDGKTLVRERGNLYPDIFRSYTSAKDTMGAISALRKYGMKDLSLYPLALTYFASSSKILSEPGVEQELQNVLRKIDQENLMAPLQVVKVLSQGGAVTMGMVKSYLSDNITRERKEIQNNRKLIDSYRTETAAKKAELQDLTSKPVTFQSRRCSACGRNLDLPTVHFLCKHSFHQRCLNSDVVNASGATDDRAECPLCKPNNDTIKIIRRQQVESREQHDLFRNELERSTNRYGTVSEWFGRGVMSAPP